MLKPTVLFSLLCMLILTSCQEETIFEDLTYKCECGSNNWDGTTYNLTDAHWIAIATEEDKLGLEQITGKEYYTTAKVEIEGDLEAHHINMRLAIPVISDGVQVDLGGAIFFDLEEVSSVSFKIEDVDFNSTSVVDEHAVIAGAFELINGLDGIDEVNFELEIVRLFEGSAAGQPFIFTGQILASQEEI